jgi:hypothetical protein
MKNKVIKWSLVEVDRTKLIPYSKNPKTRDDKGFERLRKSLD